MRYILLLTLIILFSCEEREFQNPFDPQVPKTLSILVSPREAGRINASPISSIYATDELVTLTPEANENWVFQNWEGDVSGNSVPMSLTMDSNKSVTAVFVRKNYPLTVTTQGEGAVSEAIVSSPSGREYPHGTTVRLTPLAKEGWVFESWSGDLTGTDAPKNITVDKEKHVTAKFMRPAIGALDCNSSTDTGILIAGRDAFDVSSSIPYSGGDGSSHTGQTVQSTGVTGLTATLAAGSFASGSGVLTYTITGKPNQEGTASFAVIIGDRTCVLKRTVNPVGSISALNCASANSSGMLTRGITASGVSSTVPYTGGNGSVHDGQTVQSTGVTGLTATLAAGSFANGNGTLSYAITGTPNSAGNTNFALNIGGKTCTLTLVVNPTYPSESVFCNSIPTTVIDVTNPVTGKIWMDRNLGASRVATSATDTQAFGDLYQWGRGSDGHQCRDSKTNNNLSSSDLPGHSDFIIKYTTPFDWRSPQNNNLWQGANGVNNPCPEGYRIPTSVELNEERLSWVVRNSIGAFESALNWTLSGIRIIGNGGLYQEGIQGSYWSSTVSFSTESLNLFFDKDNSAIPTNRRGWGFSVRCIKD